MDNIELMRPGYRRNHGTGLLEKPNNDAGQQSSQPCWPGCEKCAGAVIGQALPPALLAMKDEMHSPNWQQVLQARALLVEEEARRRQEDEAGLSYQWGYQARQQEESTSQPIPWGDPKEYQAMRAQEAKEQAEKEAVRQQVERRLHGLGGEQVKAQPQPEPASELDQALCAANKAHRALDDAVTTLEGRLARVLRPELTGNGPNACPVMAPLPMEIMACSACAMDAVGRLTSILDRLVL